MGEKRVAVFIDAANLAKSVEDLGYSVSFRRLKRYLTTYGQIVYLGYYSAEFSQPNHKNFLTFLGYRGYKVITKPIKVIFDRVKQRHVRKANFDVEIAVDAMQRLDTFDLCVLFSGDSDFDYLLKAIRKQGKRAIVISTRYHIARELIASADWYLDLRKIKHEILVKKKEA